MINVNTEQIQGYEITQTLDIVRGNTVRARHLGRDIFASLRNLVGGEVNEYTKLMAHAREQALQRMNDEAAKLGADAVINIRFMTSLVMQGCSEILVYGTAVKIKKN